MSPKFTSNVYKFLDLSGTMFGSVMAKDQRDHPDKMHQRKF